MTGLPTPDEIGRALDGYKIDGIEAVLRAYAEGRLIDRDDIDWEAAADVLKRDEYKPYDEPLSLHHIVTRHIIEAAIGAAE